MQDEQNKLAVKNANKGKQTLHKKYNEVDFFSSSHTIWSNGNTTYVLTWEEELPVLKSSSANASKIDTTRKQIEAAYTNRPGN